MGLFDFFQEESHGGAAADRGAAGRRSGAGWRGSGNGAQDADIVLDVEDGQDMNRAVHAVMDEEEIQIDRAGEDILYREEAEEAPAEAEIEITFEDADGEES